MDVNKCFHIIVSTAVLLLLPVTAGAADINWSTESYRAFTTSYVESSSGNVYDEEENFGPPLPVSAVARTIIFNAGCSHSTSDITSSAMNVYAKACAGIEAVTSSYAEASFLGTFIAESTLFLFDYSFVHDALDSSKLDQWITMKDLTDGTVFSNVYFNGLNGTIQVPVYTGHTIEVEFGIKSSAYSSFDTVDLDINQTAMNYSMSVVPEPVSSVLFVIGGMFFTGRRLFRRI